MLVPSGRLAGALRRAQRRLNVECYPVMTFEANSLAVQLDVALLADQFELRHAESGGFDDPELVPPKD